MKWRKRITAALLSLAMVLSLFAQWPQTALAAGEEPTGSIGLTVRFDLPQTRSAVERRNVTLTISRGAEQLELPLSGGAAVRNDFQAPVSVTAKNADGVEMTTEARLGCYQAEVSGLRAGETYDLRVTGTGYVPYSTRVTLDGYSRHVIIGTGDGTFSLGDVNGDGVLDERDLQMVEDRLGGAPEDCDLNGDGAVDVTDLAYVNYLLGETGEGEVLETSAIAAPVLEEAGLVFLSGSAGELFTGTESTTVAPASAGSALELPISLPVPVEMSHVDITCPDAAGAIQTGTAVVEAADGSILTVPFDISAPAGVHAIGPAAGERVVTIDLGRRVAVKKITIQVTRVAGQTGAQPEYATVTQIEFLKDIVPENPKNDSDLIRGLAAKAGDGMVDLAWNAVRNVTGYEVAYGTSESALTQTMQVVTNKASVTGLENQTTYYFQVTATNGTWRGRPSEMISATPEAASVPGAPSNIQVAAGDQFLRLSWGKTKDATFYQAFYRVAGESAFTQFGGDLTGTSITITGLTNGTKYELAVKAGNGKGVGPFSAIADGTPEREDLTMPDLPEDDRIDKSMIESIVMKNPGNVNRELCPNFTTDHLIDNDPATYWIAAHYSYDSYITYTFREPHDMNYFIMVPYLQGKYPNAIVRYKVQAMDVNGNTLLDEVYAAPRFDSTKKYMVMPFQMVEGVKSISIGLDEWEGGGRVSISEIAFYNGDNLADDILALFKDMTLTELKPGVTEEQIAALEARLAEKTSFYLDADWLGRELVLARGLFEKDLAVLGLVKNDFQSRSGGAEADQKAGQTASDLQPLGISAKAGATVAIYAQIPEGETVSIVPTQYFGESGVWRGSAIQLRNGRNYVTVPKIGSLQAERGGPLYVTYSGSHPEEIKLHVLHDNNAATIPVLELSNWYNMTDDERKAAVTAYVTALEQHVSVAQNVSNPATNIRNATEISTPSVLLSLPADRVLAGLRGVGNDTAAMAGVMYQDVLAWEETLFVANKVQGIIPSDRNLSDYRYPMTTRQNIRYMRMFAGAFMYAAGAHIGIGYGSASGMACGRPTSNAAPMLFGWGIAHEIGHNMDKLGKAEITNNIYALAVQAWDGAGMTKKTRLTNSNIWPKVFDKVSVGRPGTAGNVFVQLGMYWQLHLAYDDSTGPLKFFNSFFKTWKDKNAYPSFSGDDRFAVIAAQTANHNLNPFFERWGLTLSEAAKAEIAKFTEETRAIWYLNDASWIDKKSGTGAPTVTTAVSENKVTLTITNSASDSIQGYEIRRDGKPIGFTTSNAYTDDLGAANNRTYRYSVIPVDQLGNMGAEVFAPEEIRIAYDVVIDPGKYTVETAEGNAVLITMKDGAVPVTGIKVPEGVTGTVKVEVKAAAGAQWVTAKDGALTGTVTYFNKPGADSSDTRLWTYDVVQMKITGLPSGTNITLLDYPGDRVDFYEGAAAGKLKQDIPYTDSDGKKQIIPAGTLVVLGTYQGDPLYNTIEVQARYDIFNEAVTDELTSEEKEDIGGEPKLSIERPMNGYGLLFAAIAGDGETGDISDGFFLFVPDMAEEEKLNMEAGWKKPHRPQDPEHPDILAESQETLYPAEIRVVLYRTNDPYGSPGSENPDLERRVTSENLWISFPSDLPLIQLTTSN